ncbi:hypothetical protein CI238_01320 [Colletotrichum incanum]|uniref:BTB domain-containing protein n=1 Tax=Colletotrichum incanum TaxID=1573173 RepID=A0A166ZU64_COLIC|nr:hypothetical protein CI238_01320 [Colletotrichum incanum]
MSLKRKRDMDEILKSRQTKFVVGPEKEDYTSLLNGLKGGEGKIVWKNAQPATFVNLMEYAYSRDYTVPTLSKADGEEQAGNKRTNVAEPDHGSCDKSSSSDSDSDWSLPKRKVRFPSKLASQETKSSTWDFDQSVPKPEEHKSLASWMVEHFPRHVKDEESSATTTLTKDWLADTMQQNCTNIKEILLAHANLWLLADQYGITELKDLCLYRLQQSLLQSPGSNDMLRAVLETIRVVYSEPSGRPGNSLRTLLLHFCLTDMEWMTRNKDLGTLLKEVPGISTDLILHIPHDYWREIRDGGSA